MISRFYSDLESFAIKSKETYSIELKNCLKISSDIRNEMGSNVLSLEDKLRQTQVRTFFFYICLFFFSQNWACMSEDCRKMSRTCSTSKTIQLKAWKSDSTTGLKTNTSPRSSSLSLVRLFFCPHLNCLQNLDDQIEKRTKKGSIFDSLGSFGGSAKLQDIEALVATRLRGSIL